jgi:quercetin dioxygenase-like cupin family protein
MDAGTDDTGPDTPREPSGAVVLDSVRTLPLESSQPEIYDRPIGLRLLYRDPRSGAEHYAIRYPDGLRARRHRHSAGHTIVVLSGRLIANGHIVGPGSYCHFPAGTVMHHAPAPGSDCLFVILFDGPFDVHPVEV